MKVRIGKTQELVLRCLQRNGYWRRGCGWLWSSWRQTEKYLDRFVELGLVRKDDNGRYEITQEGLEKIS